MSIYKKIIVSVVILAASITLWPATVHALDIPPAPTKTHVLDQAAVIDDSVEVNISQTIFDYEKKTGNQLAVLTVKSLDGGDIFDYCNRVANTWKVGNAEANNGVVLCVAIEDRKVRIEVGRGIEPYLTDLQAHRIISQKITPEFKNGNYSAGILNGVTSIIAVIGGERLSPSPGASSQQVTGWLSVAAGVVPILVIPMVYISSYLARSKSWWAGGVIGVVPGGLYAFSGKLAAIPVLIGGVGAGLLLDWLLSKNYQQRKSSGDSINWWNSGGGFFGGTGGFGGSGSSGGGSSFGGGSFGGGGSSGSW